MLRNLAWIAFVAPPVISTRYALIFSVSKTCIKGVFRWKSLGFTWTARKLTPFVECLFVGVVSGSIPSTRLCFYEAVWARYETSSFPPQYTRCKRSLKSESAFSVKYDAVILWESSSALGEGGGGRTGFRCGWDEMSGVVSFECQLGCEEWILRLR